MELTGAKVHLIEKCSGHDGAWSAKKEFFDMSMKIAKKAVREIKDEHFDIVASDCPLSALQLDQALDAPASRPALHPIQVVRNAYGLPFMKHMTPQDLLSAADYEEQRTEIRQQDY